MHTPHHNLWTLPYRLQSCLGKYDLDVLSELYCRTKQLAHTALLSTYLQISLVASFPYRTRTNLRARSGAFLDGLRPLTYRTSWFIHRMQKLISYHKFFSASNPCSFLVDHPFISHTRSPRLLIKSLLRVVTLDPPLTGMWYTVAKNSLTSHELLSWAARASIGRLANVRCCVRFRSSH